MNSKEEEFGEDRLMEIVKPHLQGTASEISEAILSSIERFVGNAEQHDDLTMVIVRFL